MQQHEYGPALKPLRKATGVLASTEEPLYEPATRFDVLRIPILGTLLRSRWGRLPFQIVLFGVAALMVYDGFTGPDLAAANNATVLAWVIYRGLVILILLFLGNLFCFACPFTLPRTLARRLSSFGGRFPRPLRNKWTSILGLIFIFWLYEVADLWDSPWLTAWVTVAYFVAAFVLEALFSESPFCKYVCPLGAFNFTYAATAPLQIEARNPQVCRECANKECVNNSAKVLGCGTELFVPAMSTSMDCTLCLDCARACPYDNVALALRSPTRFAVRDRWPGRWDMAFLFVALAFLGLTNAFGMVAPVQTLHTWLVESVGIRSEAIRLLILLGIGGAGLPVGFLFLAARASAWLDGAESIRARFFASRFSPAFVPLGLGVWLAHYGFHLAIAGLTIIPTFHDFLLRHGLILFGERPHWELGFLLPMPVVFPLQVAAVLAGFFGSLLVLGRASLDSKQTPGSALKVALPWVVGLLLLCLAALAVFNLPMEMRGMFMRQT